MATDIGADTGCDNSDDEYAIERRGVNPISVPNDSWSWIGTCLAAAIGWRDNVLLK